MLADVMTNIQGSKAVKVYSAHLGIVKNQLGL